MSSHRAFFRRFAVSPLALAAAAALGVAMPAQAQFFSTSGFVSGGPINPASPTLNLTGTEIAVGNASGASGSFAQQAGASMQLGRLAIATAQNSTGTVTITGAGTTALLSGTNAQNRLEVGLWGNGSLTVSGGALLDATVNASACSTTQFCSTFIGDAAGSTGTLNIDGAGSEVRLLQYLGIGQTEVYSTAVNGFTLGTPGGTTNAQVNITGGGKLSSQVAVIGRVPGGNATIGTEKAFGTVLIDGAGSSWIATRDTVGINPAFVGVGQNAGATGTVTVRNGGQMVIGGPGGSPTTYDSLGIGINGATGTVTVTGPGSSLTVTGNNPFINVGRSGATGNGTLNVLNGATAQTLKMIVGRDGATGTLLIDGANSKLSQIGVGTPGFEGGAGTDIGYNGGSGAATVSNGAQWLIGDGGADSRTPFSSIYTGNPYLEVGRDAGGTGSLTITGPGSTVQISASSLAPASGGDNYNPYMAVGRYAGSNGTLTVSDGGKLLLTGNAISTVAATRITGLHIGGDIENGPGGTGVATVTGAGSQIVLSGSDALIFVGRGLGANGTLNVNNGGAVSALGMVVGRDVGGVGNVTLVGGTLNFAGQETGDTLSGAFLTVGSGSGTGFVTATSGSSINLTNPGALGAGVNIGGSGNYPLGTGTVTVSNASSLTLAASGGAATLNVGRSGSGTLDVVGNSSVSVSGVTANVNVGLLAGATGTLTVGSGSSLTSDVIAIGGNSDTVAGGTGTANVGGFGSKLVATGNSGTILVGRGGNGTLNVTDQATVNGTVLAVGLGAGGVGTATLNNATLALANQRSDGVGAGLGIGVLGGTGSVTISNSTVTLSNPGSGGANLNVGGSPINPLGTGTLTVNNSTVTLSAGAGLANVRIGHDGSGTATLNASALSVTGGSVIVAGQPGSTGTLTLNAGSTIVAHDVGIGATLDSAGNLVNGGTGHLVLNNSTVTTDTFELGAQSILSGNNGTINASGNVLIAGTIMPGNSPGRVNINCNLIMLPGSELILDVLANGSGGYDIDHFVLGNDATFDLSKVHILFNFLGNTDPTAFAASGGFDLDNFIQSQDLATGNVTGLSTQFAAGQTWGDVVDLNTITATSSVFDITGISVTGDGTGTVTAMPVPEPGTWVLMVVGLAGLAVLARRRAPRVAAVRPK